jgi:hypothetical protein
MEGVSVALEVTAGHACALHGERVHLRAQRAQFLAELPSVRDAGLVELSREALDLARQALLLALEAVEPVREHLRVRLAVQELVLDARDTHPRLVVGNAAELRGIAPLPNLLLQIRVAELLSEIGEAGDDVGSKEDGLVLKNVDEGGERQRGDPRLNLIRRLKEKSGFNIEKLARRADAAFWNWIFLTSEDERKWRLHQILEKCSCQAFPE